MHIYKIYAHTHTCPYQVSMLHYRWVKDCKRVGYTFISWYEICKNNTN